MLIEPPPTRLPRSPPPTHLHRLTPAHADHLPSPLTLLRGGMLTRRRRRRRPSDTLARPRSEETGDVPLIQTRHVGGGG